MLVLVLSQTSKPTDEMQTQTATTRLFPSFIISPRRYQLAAVFYPHMGVRGPGAGSVREMELQAWSPDDSRGDGRVNFRC